MNANAQFAAFNQALVGVSGHNQHNLQLRLADTLQ